MSSASTVSAGVLADTGTYLDIIIENTIREVAERKRHTPHLAPYPEPPRDFVAALHRETVSLVAEVKHASPSKGILIDPFEPVALAMNYAENGASAVSVLTDERFFQGSLADLSAVRKAVDVPILRKDFVIDAFQIEEARAVGADAALLIVGVLDDAKLADLYAITAEHGLSALVEVHDAAELDRALKLEPRLIGVNARDLRTFRTDLNTIRQLAARVPSEITLVAESGIHTAADVEAMAAAGARAVLVGEALITAADRTAKVRELSGVKRKP
jgi:indole-3-glycerol phosphate synthase